MRDIVSGAIVAAKHVLGMARIALAPGLVVQLVDLARAVIALVEGDGDEAVVDLGFVRWWAFQARMVRSPR